MSETDFATRVGQILEAGALNVALGLGYQLGLFEALDGAGALSSDELAAKADLNPRYVHEWLGAVLAGGVVELAPDDPTRFVLPDAHALVLCRRGGAQNLGVYTQELGLLVEGALSGVRAGFRTGQGLGYESYPAFHAFMGELADRKHEQALVGEFLPSVAEGAIEARLRAGGAACDLGCGSGRALLLLAAAFPASEFVGVDLDEGALEAGRDAARAAGLTNVEFLTRDAARLAEAPGELAARFDWVSAFDAIHDQLDPAAALRGARALLKDGGVFSLVDIAAESELAENAERPLGAFLYTVSLLHCLPIGLGPEGKGAGLGMLWGRQRALDLLAEAGFEVEVAEIPNDPFNVHYCCRLSSA
ncbi:MAG: methyltransferase domain-containing protein [Planctomycetes bacterium]|nr:methyltransferase domain-containing protein [Planctomycetota bacterium]